MMIRVLKIFVTVMVILNLGALLIYVALPEFFSVEQQEADLSWTEGWLATEEKDGKRLSSVELHELRAQKSSVNIIEKEEGKLRELSGLEQSSLVDDPEVAESQSSKGLLWNPRAVKSSDLFASEDSANQDTGRRSESKAALDIKSKAIVEAPQASLRKSIESNSGPRGEALVPELDVIHDNYQSIPAVEPRTELATAVFQSPGKIDAPPLKLTIPKADQESTTQIPTSTTAGHQGHEKVLSSSEKKVEQTKMRLSKDGEEPKKFNLETQLPKEVEEPSAREEIPNGFVKIANKIYDPFSRELEPEAWVRCSGKGTLEVMIHKALLDNLEGAPLSQDHLEMWIHKTGTNPPEGYGEIAYQFGVGLGKEPWVLQFISAESPLEPKIRRHESRDFVVLEIGGFEDRNLLWNLVFSKAIKREQGYWEQGLLFSTARGFEWGKKDSLFALGEPLRVE